MSWCLNDFCLSAGQPGTSSSSGDLLHPSPVPRFCEPQTRQKAWRFGKRRDPFCSVERGLEPAGPWSGTFSGSLGHTTVSPSSCVWLSRIPWGCSGTAYNGPCEYAHVCGSTHRPPRGALWLGAVQAPCPWLGVVMSPSRRGSGFLPPTPPPTHIPATFCLSAKPPSPSRVPGAP